jgi:photosystem II stability/assembly factor-like uncharacterized protein
VAWLALGSEVWHAVAAGQPQRVGSPVADGGEIVALAAIDDRHAHVLVDPGDGGAVQWRTTSDGGATWRSFADPCGGTRFPGSLWSSMASAPDGSLWAVCAGSPATGNMPKDLVVSPNGGRTWVSRGELETAGYGTDVYPFSATEAWRTGGRADVYRTIDGTQWMDVAKLESQGPLAFVAIDPRTAVYLADLGSGPSIHTTTDGGARWRSYSILVALVSSKPAATPTTG